MMSSKKFWEKGPLVVSKNQKYLQNGEEPFFWLGDTAWLLFHKLNQEEIYTYLKNRKEKGFNVIQAVIIHSLPDTQSDSLPGANVCTKIALKNNDFSQPLIEEYGYWDRIDQAIQIAESLGLYMALLPVWGSMVKQGYLNENNVGIYTQFIVDRYKKYPNIIWLLGGDIRGDVGFEVWDTMGSIIKKETKDQLVGFHPFGRTSSSRWFNDEEWLDFNMFQSGHRRYDQIVVDNKSFNDNLIEDEPWYGEDNWKYVAYDHGLERIKPTIDGEPSYEQIPQGLHNSTEPYWQDYHIRRYAYWSVFAGAFGFTYGSNAVMQFYKKGAMPAYGVKETWNEAIHHSGSSQMIHLKNLMERFDYTQGRPGQELLVGDEGEKEERISVFMGEDFILCYNYLGRDFEINLGLLSKKLVDAWWFDPITGVYSYIGRFYNQTCIECKPVKKKNNHNDWVLVLEAIK